MISLRIQRWFWGRVLQLLNWAVYIRDGKLIPELHNLNSFRIVALWRMVPRNDDPLVQFVRKPRINIDPVIVVLNLFRPIWVRLHPWRDAVTTKIMECEMSAWPQSWTRRTTPEEIV